MELYGNVIHCALLLMSLCVAHVVLPMSKLAKSEDFIYKIMFMLVLVSAPVSSVPAQ
jgi:hypothetical protein